MFEKKVVLRFLGLTFAIAVICWGICIALAQFGVTLASAPWLNVFYFAGGGSPAIASYIVLKRHGLIKGFRDWMRSIFTVKRPFWMYAFAVGLVALYYVSMILIGGAGEMMPLYLLLVLTPLMVVGGGHEEAGWRLILQPALEKKLSFAVASLIVGAIWALWHLPLFFIPGVGQFGQNFGIFAIYVMGNAFALGAIRKITDSVFLCMLFHCIFNAASTVLNPNLTWLNASISAALLITVSLVSVALYSKQSKKGARA